MQERKSHSESLIHLKRLTFRQCLKQLWIFLKPNRGKFYIAIIAILVMQIIYALMPTVEGQILSSLQVDLTAMKEGVPGAHIQMSVIITILMELLAMYIVKITAQFIGAFTLTDSIQKTMYEIREAVQHKISCLPISYFDSQKTGDVLSRIINDVETVSNALQQTLQRVIGAVCTFVFTLIMMLRISWGMTGIICIGLPLMALVSAGIVRKSQPVFDRQQAALAALNGTVNELYAGSTEIMVYNHQKQAIADFEKVNHELSSQAFKAQFISGVISPLTSLITYIMIGICALYGCLQTLNGHMLIGDLQAFIRYIWAINDPISQISQLSSQVQSAFSGMNRLFTFLSLPEELSVQTSAQNQQRLQDIESIDFDHVVFSYAADAFDPDRPTSAAAQAAAIEQADLTLEDPENPAAALIEEIERPLYEAAAVQPAMPDPHDSDISNANRPDAPLMKDMSFSIRKGQRIAVVGPTGAGKTTLINLLLRFYNIQSGSIRINGIDIRALSYGDLRDLFGLVLQDAWLFEGTVEDNLKYGKEDATQEELDQAVQKAEIQDLIASMPHGYQTMISESADNISQGEKQLLTIARALLKDPKILILDEATSSVDTRLEKKIQKAMDILMESRTSIVIAHRLSTITSADLILVMNHGEIVESGTHQQLLNQNGMYARLYNSQFQDTSLPEADA